MALNFVQLWFAFYSAFSGQTMFESWTLSAYNVFFTSLPVIVLGVLDRDISQKRILENPQLYMLGQERYYFNSQVFWGWAVNGLIHSLIVFFITMGAYSNDIPSPRGLNASLWMVGITMYSCVILTVNLKLTLELASWTFVHHLVVWGTVAFWFVYIAVYSHFYPTATIGAEFAGMDTMLYGTPTFYMISFLVVSMCLSRDISWKYLKRTYTPEWYHIVQEIEDEDELKTEKQKITVDIKPQLLRISLPRIQRRSHTGFAFSDPGETPSSSKPASRRFTLANLNPRNSQFFRRSVSLAPTQSPQTPADGSQSALNGRVVELQEL